MQTLREPIRTAIDRLDGWLTRNGWAGYDPYDLRGDARLLKPVGFGAKQLGRVLLSLDAIYPTLGRRLLKVPRQINAKAMGLFAEGYRRLYEISGDETHLKQATAALTWLEEHPCRGYAGLCWGYPFDWQSRIFIPKGTPSVVVSATAGRAFLGFYRMTGERRYLDACKSICEFFRKDLRIDRLDSERICFSYTPLDTFHVHNANLMAAELLLDVGEATRDDNYAELGRQATRYALSEQNEDGSICYWGKDQRRTCEMDHYHSGFEIRSLHAIWKITSDAAIYRALKSYYRYYLEHFFECGTIPRMTPKSLYPINIHSCAEAILCNSTLAADFPEGNEVLKRVIPWTLQHMQNRDGSFSYLIRKIGGVLKWRLRVPYIRWGQAWMLRALSESYRLTGPAAHSPVESHKSS